MKITWHLIYDAVFFFNHTQQLLLHSRIPPNTCDFRLGDLSLEVGSHLQFIFDLLQEWEFDLYVEKIEPANDKMKKPKILKSHGEPPAQYGEEGESWE